jgi:transposase
MIRVRLPEAEAQELEARFRSTQDRKLRDRLQIVLLAHKGRKHQDIAADLCVHRRSVQRWLNAYCEGGLAGLMPRKARGKGPGVPACLADETKGWVIGGPAKQGLDRANWTHEELADHLKKAKGVPTSRSAMQRFRPRIGIRLYRPAYRYPRGDPDKQAKAREGLAGLKKGRRRAGSSC